LNPIREVVRDKTFKRAIVFRAQRHLIENPDDAWLVEGHPNGSLIGKQKVSGYAATPPPECDEIASACRQWDRNLDWIVSGHGLCLRPLGEQPVLSSAALILNEPGGYPLMARNVHGAMSALSPLSGVKRKLDFGAASQFLTNARLSDVIGRQG